MFQDKSRAGVGMVAFILFSFLQWIGLDVDEGTVTEFVLASFTVASFVMWVWGQADRKDLVWGLWRK